MTDGMDGVGFKKLIQSIFPSIVNQTMKLEWLTVSRDHANDNGCRC